MNKAESLMTIITYCSLILASLYNRAGETWGLYFSDYEDELRQLLEESTERWLLLTMMCTGHDITLTLHTAGT